MFFSFCFSPNSIGLRQRAFLYTFSLIIPYYICIFHSLLKSEASIGQSEHSVKQPAFPTIPQRRFMYQLGLHTKFIVKFIILFLYNSKQYTNELSLFIQYPDNFNSISFNSVEYIIFSAEQKSISFPGFYCF